jgi:hypothetical protein
MDFSDVFPMKSKHAKKHTIKHAKKHAIKHAKKQARQHVKKSNKGLADKGLADKGLADKGLADKGLSKEEIIANKRLLRAQKRAQSLVSEIPDGGHSGSVKRSARDMYNESDDVLEMIYNYERKEQRETELEDYEFDVQWRKMHPHGDYWTLGAEYCYGCNGYHVPVTDTDTESEFSGWKIIPYTQQNDIPSYGYDSDDDTNNIPNYCTPVSESNTEESVVDRDSVLQNAVIKMGNKEVPLREIFAPLDLLPDPQNLSCYCDICMLRTAKRDVLKQITDRL